MALNNYKLVRKPSGKSIEALKADLVSQAKTLNNFRERLKDAKSKYEKALRENKALSTENRDLKGLHQDLQAENKRLLKEIARLTKHSGVSVKD